MKKEIQKFKSRSKVNCLSVSKISCVITVYFKTAFLLFELFFFKVFIKVFIITDTNINILSLDFFVYFTDSNLFFYFYFIINIY